MHRTNRSVLAATAVGLVLLAAGCGGGEPAGPPAQDPSATPAADPGVVWIDTVCGSMLELSTTVSSPKVDTSSPEATFRSYSAFIGSYIAGIDKAIQTTQAAGPSPLEGGDAMLKGIIDPLIAYKGKLEQSKAAIDKAKADDPASVAAATTALQVLKSPPTFDVPSTPEVAEATSAAPSCKRLHDLGKQAATSPSAAPDGG